MSEITPHMASIIADVSARLGIKDPQWLTNLIAFETGGTFDPAQENSRSSAKGLIQFIDSTAQGLGYESSRDLVLKNPTFDEQMQGPVYKYLKTWSPFPEEYLLYMSVFYPAARKYPPDTTFLKIYQDRYGADAEKKYAAFAKANPGINTPQDYVNFIKKKANLPVISTGLGLGVIVMGVVAAIWLLGRKNR